MGLDLLTPRNSYLFDNILQGRQLTGKEFDARALTLRHELLQAQFALRDQNIPSILVIGGLDGAGKGVLVQRLNEWMDPRGIETNTYWQSSDEENSRPYFWRFWNKLPSRGQIAIFLGSWYTHPAQAAIAGVLDDAELTRACESIVAFERMLVEDGACLVKLWLHVSEDTHREQLQELAPGKQQIPRVTDRPYELIGVYDDTLKIASRLIEASDGPKTPWHLVDAEDRYARDIDAAEQILAAMQDALSRSAKEAEQSSTESMHPAISNDSSTSQLNQVDLSQKLRKADYKTQLGHYQAQLQDLAWEAYREERSVVAVFEGWDAAGKGSAIRRVTAALDPRLYYLTQIAAPSEEELAHHYLWRFWRRLQRDGRATLFDRSWYGRVLVERVEGFAEPAEWQRAYAEINQFEEQLVEHGCIVLKFWLHISKDEQLARFQAREELPHKRHKITPDDWRNRDKWEDYEAAVEDMLSHTGTATAPWTLVAGDNKRFARIQILETICDVLANNLERGSG